MRRVFLTLIVLLCVFWMTACNSALPTLPPGPIKVVTLGDSQTAGYGDERESPNKGGYPATLLALISKLRSGSTVRNLGIGALVSKQMIEGTKDHPDPLQQAIDEHPQIVCVWIGSNDLLFNNDADQEKDDLTAYTQNLDTILSKLSGHDALLVLALLDDPSKRPGIATRSYPLGKPWWVNTTDYQADLARMGRRASAYNKVITDKAAQYKAVLVNMNLDLFTDPNLLSTDGLHPSWAGYQQIAKIWFDALLPYLGHAPALKLTLTAAAG